MEIHHGSVRALDSAGNVSSVGQGDGFTAQIPVPTTAGGIRPTCALLKNNTMKCWGYGGTGQLGQRNTDTIGDEANEMDDNLTAVDLGTNRTAAKVVVSDYHACALLDNATVKCWGTKMAHC